MRSVSSDTLRQLARLDLSPEWEVRLVDQDGRVWPIPPQAIKSRQRGTELDGSTWRLSLSLERSLLPSGVDPLQYHEIEMDLLLGSDRVPYFRGIIDHPRGGESLQGGAITEPLELECLGMLQKAKGYRVNTFRVDPANLGLGVFRLTALCEYQDYAPGTVVTAGQPEKLPNAGTYDFANYHSISKNTDPVDIYFQGTDYTIDTSTTPITINWLVTPTTTRRIVYYSVERFTVPVYYPQYTTAALPSFMLLPDGRKIDDVFQTYITEIDVPNKRVTLADPTGWSSVFGAVETMTGEYVAFNVGGVDYFRKAATGGFDVDFSRLTIHASESLPAGLAVGDSVRLVTTEGYQAWDDDRLYRCFTSSAGVTEWNRTFFQPVPNLGFVLPVKPRNWSPSEEVWADVYIILQSWDPNRVENVIEALLTGLGLFDASEVTTENTGAFIKNFAFTATDADQILATLGPNCLPPNAFIHDEPDGTISIKPYRQATEPDWVMRGAHEITEADQPEPISAVTVIAESDQEINLAPRWFNNSSNFTNPERVVDGSKSTSAAPTVNTGQATVTFRVPRANPLTSFPVIDKIRVSGQGLLSVYVTRSGTSYYLAGYTFRPMESGTVEIPGEELHRVLTVSTTLTYQELTFRFDPITTGDNLSTVTVGTAAACSEIEILTKQAGAHKAEITDDTGKAEADQGADAFGTIWTQGDTSLRESWRYAPASYVKRTSARYYAPGSGTTNKPRNKILRLRGISPQACRNYAEKWLDYSLMDAKSYTVRGILDPRAQLGDTVRIFRKDGSYLDLFLWGIEDGGGPDDLSCTYSMRNYS